MFIMQIETDSCIYMYFQVLGKNSSTWYMFYDMRQCSSTISMLLYLKLFVQILICTILHVVVICGIGSMSPIVLQDTLVLTAIMLGVPCPISKVILASKVWVGGEGCGMITAI